MSHKEKIVLVGIYHYLRIGSYMILPNHQFYIDVYQKSLKLGIS